MANRTATVISDGLKLRTSPNGEVIDELAAGDRLEVFGHTQPGKLEWLEVKVLRARGTAQIGRRGYVAAHGPNGDRFVRIDEEVAQPRPAPYVPPIKPVKNPLDGTMLGWIVVAAVAVVALWTVLHLGPPTP